MEFLPTKDAEANGGHVVQGCKVGWRLYHPEERQYYVLEAHDPSPEPDLIPGFIVHARPYRPGNTVQTFAVDYGDSGHPREPLTAIEKAIMEEQEIIAATEETEKAAALATEALRQKRFTEALLKAQQEAANAKHQMEIHDLRNKCFPTWENEKALKLRLAGAFNEAQAIQVKRDVDAQESILAAAIEIHLSLTSGLITWQAHDSMMKENKIPEIVQRELDDKYALFGLEKKLTRDDDGGRAAAALGAVLGTPFFPLIVPFL